MRLSDHAKTRWQERCRGLIPEDELATLRPAGKRIIKMLNWLWDDMHGTERPDPGRKVLVSENGVVVIACNDMAVTVMRARQIKSWYHQRHQRRTWHQSRPVRPAPRTS